MTGPVPGSVVGQPTRTRRRQAVERRGRRDDGFQAPAAMGVVDAARCWRTPSSTMCSERNSSNSSWSWRTGLEMRRGGGDWRGGRAGKGQRRASGGLARPLRLLDHVVDRKQETKRQKTQDHRERGDGRWLK